MGDIVLQGITKRFGGIPAVNDIDLTVRDGELLALVGPSGCGKTTLLRIVAGLERPTSGSVIIDGREMTDRPARKRDVGFVFQDYALFPHLDVRSNLSFNLRMQGRTVDIDRRVAATAELLDIEELLDRDIDELSGGQKQRVALGRAIAGEPTVFLLDEPLANLDATLRDQMQAEIVRLHRQLGTTTIHVTHNQREALAIGDRVAVIRDGEIQQIGTPERVYNTPESLFIARFVGSPTMNTVNGRYEPAAQCVVVDQFGEQPWRIPVQGSVGSSHEVVIGSRPEDTAIARATHDGDQWVTATVELVEFSGADQYVHLRPRADAELIARVGSGQDIDRGDQVSVRFNPDRLHLFDAESGGRISPDRPKGGISRTQSESTSRER